MSYVLLLECMVFLQMLIEKDVENAMRGADEVFSAIMDSVDDGIGRQDNSLSE